MCTEDINPTDKVDLPYYNIEPFFTLPLEVGVDLGGERVNISANKIRLIDDLYSGLTAAGINPNLARQIADNCQLSLFPQDFWRYVKEQQQATNNGHPNGNGIIGKLIEYFPKEPALGYSIYVPEYGGNPPISGIMINPNQIVENIPHGLPFGVKVEILLQVLNSTWRHERQHIINNADPALRQLINEQSKNTRRTATQYPLIIASIILLASELTRHQHLSFLDPRLDPRELYRQLGILTSTYALVYPYVLRTLRHNSIDERFARVAQRYGTNLPGLFEITSSA